MHKMVKTYIECYYLCESKICSKSTSFTVLELKCNIYIALSCSHRSSLLEFFITP